MKFFEKKLKYHRIPYTNAIQEIMLACFYIQGEQVMRKRNDCFENDLSSERRPLPTSYLLQLTNH